MQVFGLTSEKDLGPYSPQMEKRKHRRRVYKPTKFGEGLQPGSAEWELIVRQCRKQRRDEDRAWEERRQDPTGEGQSYRHDPDAYWGPLNFVGWLAFSDRFSAPWLRLRKGCCDCSGYCSGYLSRRACMGQTARAVSH
jgi:hypothetical protein